MAGSSPFWKASAPATPAQLDQVRSLAEVITVTDAQLCALVEVESFSALTKGQAIALIALLRNSAPEEVRAAVAVKDAGKRDARQ